MGVKREIRIAVPRGALFQGTLDLLDALGLDTVALRSDSRKLLFEDVGAVTESEIPVSVITMRPSDVPTYVEYGAAHLGITGKDNLMEERERDVYEFADLGYGACRMVFATPQERDHSDEVEQRLGAMRIATKYPRVTSRYFEETGRQVEAIEVRGSVELAPMVGLAEGIVDLTATGGTLRANKLREREEIATCTARLIANAVAHKLMSGVVDDIAAHAVAWRDRGE